MQQFAKKLVGFFLGLTIVILIILFKPILHHGFPPPKLSSSITFNAKMNFVRNNLPDSIDVLAIGSSMTLNNIYTPSVVKSYGSRYLNCASWSQNMEEDYKVISILVKHVPIKRVIISSNYGDFCEDSSKFINFGLVEKYLFGSFVHNISRLNYNLPDFISEAASLDKLRKGLTSYGYLNFDRSGGASYRRRDFVINPGRWNGNSFSKMIIDDKQYSYLDSLANFCRMKGISLVFVQGPFRSGFYANLSGQRLQKLNEHLSKSASIIKRNHQTYINALDTVWQDDLFVDYSHFHEDGAKVYTDFILSKMDAN